MKNRKGISLIVLSITILVMAILAATVIISLEDSGIIGRSKNTVKSQNYSTEYTRLNVIKNGILTDNLGVITVEEYIAELKNKGIIEENVIENADGSITVITKTGFEVVVAQSGESNLNINIEGYNQANNNTGNDNNAGNNNSGNDTEPEPPLANAFTFTINGTTYYAEENMTWGAWLDSRYNTLGCYKGDSVYMDGSTDICLGSKVYISEAWEEVPYLYISKYTDWVGGDIHTNTAIENNGVYYIADQRGEWTSFYFYSCFVVDGHYIAFDPISPNDYIDGEYGTLSWIDHLAYGHIYALQPSDCMFMASNSDFEPWDQECEVWLSATMFQPYNWYEYEYDFTTVVETIEATKAELQKLKNEDFVVGVYDWDTGDMSPYYLCYSDGTRVKYGDNIMEFHLGEYILVAK